MHLTRLDIAGFRRLENVSLVPGPGVTLLVGPNGAGKTSVLEAMHLLAYGRSFRGRVRDGLIRDGDAALQVFAEWQSADGATHKVGLRHTGQAWEGRLDGQAVAHLGELCAALAVVTFEPGSHALVGGGGEGRRRLLDWGLFHVEPEFLGLWRRYARALKQRNALLKRGGEAGLLDVWDQELAWSGELLSAHRQRYLDAWTPHLQAAAAQLLPAAGMASLLFQPGWRHEELSLADALVVSRERDRSIGHTSVGPHRADWRLQYRHLPGWDRLSRGQGKLTALAILLSQAGLHAELRGEWPVVSLDDLASELDQAHQRYVLEWLTHSGAQVFITGTEVPRVIRDMALSCSVFHVEQGGFVDEARDNLPH